MCVKVIASQRWDVFETRCRSYGTHTVCEFRQLVIYRRLLYRGAVHTVNLSHIVRILLLKFY